MDFLNQEQFAKELEKAIEEYQSVSWAKEFRETITLEGVSGLTLIMNRFGAVQVEYKVEGYGRNLFEYLKIDGILKEIVPNSVDEIVKGQESIRVPYIVKAGKESMHPGNYERIATFERKENTIFLALDTHVQKVDTIRADVPTVAKIVAGYVKQLKIYQDKVL